VIKAFLTCLLTAVVTSAVAEESITVYQLDGSIHCHEGQTSTPAEASEELKQAGVKVLSAESRSLPTTLTGQCGTPTGMANVLVVDAADWKQFIRRRPDARGFGVWVFDRPLVEVFKYDGSLQCKRGKEIPLDVMAKQLSDKGIEVKASRKGTDGRLHIAVCGASTGKLNVYSIASAALTQAEALGFRLLITRQMTNEIKKPASAGRAAVQMRTPPRSPDVGQGSIPKIW